MIVGFSKHGKGQGGPAVQYLTKSDGREKDPTILQGDPELIQSRIDQNPNEWKYTSGVLSFAPEDVVTEDQERQLIADFENTAFPGIDPENRPEGLWVRHEHAGHHEMHYLYPRQLNDGRAYNMRPPGDKDRWDAFRDVANHSHGWSDPDDPRRLKSLSLPDHVMKTKQAGKDPRESVLTWAVDRIQAGAINNRTELIEQLKEVGFNVPKTSGKFITVEGGGEKFRCKGPFFSESFVSRQSIGNDLREREAAYQRSLPEKLEKARTKLGEFDRERAKYNRERFGRSERELAESRSPELVANNAPDRGDLPRLLERELGVERVSSEPSHERSTGIERPSAENSQGNEKPSGREPGRDAGRDPLGRDDREKDRISGHERDIRASSEEKINERPNPTRERVTNVREAVDSRIGRSERTAAERKSAVNRHVEGARATYNQLAKSSRELIEKAVPALDKFVQNFKLQLEKLRKTKAPEKPRTQTKSRGRGRGDGGMGL